MFHPPGFFVVSSFSYQTRICLNSLLELRDTNLTKLRLIILTYRLYYPDNTGCGSASHTHARTPMHTYTLYLFMCVYYRCDTSQCKPSLSRSLMRRGRDL